MSKVAIVNYQMGNIRSVFNAVKEVGGEPVITGDPDELRDFDKIILPGVGAFEQAITYLNETGLYDALNGAKARGANLLGICLGMQLMCTQSEEGGLHQGFDWVSASVKPFIASEAFKVPHIGWNNLYFKRHIPYTTEVAEASDVYFVHSYFVDCENQCDIVAASDYGQDFVSIFQKDNVVGMQFHPEKSQQIGLKMLQGFVSC